MNPEDYTVRKHVPAQRSRGRRIQLALIGLAAFLIGGVGGFAVLRLPALERQPDQAAVDAMAATPSASVVAAEIAATEIAAGSTAAPATPEDESVNAAEALPGLPADVQAAAPASVVNSTTYRSAGAALTDALAARPPTATSTPVPPVESVEGVIGLGGADVWDAEDGRRLAQLAQGAAVTVRERSTDGAWLRIVVPQAGEEQAIDGWTRSDDVIVFDPSRLAVRDVVIMPVTPTPTLDATAIASAPTAAPSSAASTPAAGAADSGKEDASVARRTPVTGDGPIARVLLADTRLNVRAGPGASYRVIAKALPDETFAILGKDESGKWLQLALPDVEGGFGWAALEFLESSVRVATLPVVTTISAAPAYEDSAGPETGYAAPHKPPHRAAMAPPASVTGLRGKLLLQQSWGGSIYIYDLETGSLRLLTGGFDPSFSPDGKTVAFTRAGGEHGLYLIDSDGSNERMIFNGRELLRSPKWSPDGQWIVFERGDESVRCRYTGSRCTDPDTGNEDFPIVNERQERLARVDVNGKNYRDLAVLQRARVPDWNEAGVVYQSPAGIQITRDSPDFATSELVFFNIRKQYEMDPDWQPGGGRIVFHRREASHWEIFSVNPDGSGLKALTMPSFTLVPELPSNVAPAWSPDGRHIVFLSNRTPDLSAGPWHVWVMDADGSNQRMLPVELDFTYTFVSEQMIDWGR